MYKIMTWELRDRYVGELNCRFDRLQNLLIAKNLASPTDGCKAKHRWPNPDVLCKIDTTDLSLAIEDFKTILKEIKRK